jgi:beta-carotene hydroxylase
MPAVVDTIRVDRRWIGAPAGTLTNPTVWLLVATYLLLGLGTWGWFAAGWPAWATIAVNALAIYVGFTPLHDAMHGVAHSSRWMNAAIGRLGGTPLTISLPLFRGVHYEHHSHTNDPARDPDLVVAHRPRLLLPLWLLGVTVTYRLAFYRRQLWRSRGQLVEALMTDVALHGLPVIALLGGWLGSLIVVWLAPAAFAVLALAFAFDFLPHYPYDTDARYFDTRITPGRLLNAVLLGQNHHLIHHLWTTIPWYRYQRVFGETRAALAARGCRIGWTVTPLPEGIPSLAARA